MKSLYVRANFEQNQSVWCRVLSEAQCEEIYYAALEVMERTGIDINDSATVDLLKKGGCWVDGNRVRFPSSLVEWAIRTAPSRVALCDREGNRKLFLESKNVYFGPGAGNSLTRDPNTGERRRPVKKDVELVATCCDALPNIDFAMDLGTPSDVPAADVNAFEALVLNTSKPIIQSAADAAQAQNIVDMASAVAGGLEALQRKPFVCLYNKADAAKAVWAADKGIPQVFAPVAKAGSTAPATMAGTITKAVSEGLAGLVAAQLKRNGASFVLGGLVSIMDDSSDDFLYGAPEMSLMAAGLANVVQYMKLPSFSTAGGTDSKGMDAQAGAEGAFTLMAAGLSGANLVHGLGNSEYGNVGSVEQMVLGEEAIGMVKRIMRGIWVNDERLAVDVIDNVGPGGHFLGESHTMSYFRTETWFPTLISRLRYDDWVAAGATSLGDRAKKKIQKIVNEHKAAQLSADVAAKVKDIAAKAGKR